MDAVEVKQEPQAEKGETACGHFTSLDKDHQIKEEMATCCNKTVKITSEIALESNNGQHIDGCYEVPKSEPMDPAEVKEEPPDSCKTAKSDLTSLYKDHKFKDETVNMVIGPTVIHRPVVQIQPQHTGLLKRFRTGPGTSTGPRSSTKERRNLVVVVEREDGIPVDEALAGVIRKRLLVLIVDAAKAGVKGKPLQFATSGLVSEGYFLVAPMTSEAKDWLLACNFGFHGEVKLRVRRLERARVAMWVPGPEDGQEIDTLWLLRIQNADRKEDLRLDEWRIINKEVAWHGTRYLISVPTELEEKWGDSPEKWLSFQALQVKVILLRTQPREEHKKRRLSAELQLPM